MNAARCSASFLFHSVRYRLRFAEVVSVRLSLCFPIFFSLLDAATCERMELPAGTGRENRLRIRGEDVHGSSLLLSWSAVM